MRPKPLILRLAALCLALTATVGLTAAPRSVEVSGESTYYDDGRHSRLECMELAAQQARVDALAREFGTVVTQSLLQNERLSSRGETTDFLSLSFSEVKGEWLGDINEPQYKFDYDLDNNLIVTCKVRGRARGISNESAEFEALVLRNGTTRQNADTRFRNGDEMYLMINPAADAFVSVFLEDEQRNVYQLLPYPQDSKGEVRLRQGRDHVLFSAAEGKGKYGPEEELVMTSDSPVEYNRIYVICSPDPYAMPASRFSGGLKTTPSKEFNKWLMKSRRNDPKMGVQTIALSITNENL